MNYCVKARLGNQTIRGCGLPQVDTSSIDITSDICKDNLKMNLGIVSGDTVFDRICVCFSDNCNEGEIIDVGKFFQAHDI